MTSSNFSFGERGAIASAYAQMYAPKSMMNESCCGCRGKKRVAKKPVKEACGDKLPTKHTEPKKTGSKLGERKILPFDKRDAKSTAKKFTPPMKKNCCDSVKEACGGKLPTKHSEPKKTGSKLGQRKMLPFDKRDAKPSCKNGKCSVKKCMTEGFCITDGDKTLCTNDVNESYFNKEGICGETRIYESAISALKDIKKVNSRRKPNKKYCIRKCECVDESFRFAQNEKSVNEAWWNPVDMVSNVANGAANLAKGAVNGAANLGKGVVNGVADTVNSTVGQIPVVGGAVSGLTNTARDGINGAVDLVGNTTNGAVDLANGTVGGVTNTVNKAGSSFADYMKNDDKKNLQPFDANSAKKEQEAAMNATTNGASQYRPGQQPTQQPTPQPTPNNQPQAQQSQTQPTNAEAEQKSPEDIKAANVSAPDAAAPKVEQREYAEGSTTQQPQQPQQTPYAQQSTPNTMVATNADRNKYPNATKAAQGAVQQTKAAIQQAAQNKSQANSNKINELEQKKNQARDNMSMTPEQRQQRIAEIDNKIRELQDERDRVLSNANNGTAYGH